MGLGDVILSIGEAKRLHAKTGKHVLILRPDGMPVKSDLFNGIPYLVRSKFNFDCVRMVNGPGARPYIANKTPTKWTWRAYAPTPADIVFTPAELAFAEPYRGAVMLEPHTKAIGHTNKAWNAISWQQLDTALHALGGASKVRTVQCGPAGTRLLLHTEFVTTDTFRKACAVLSVCRAFVGAEGGLMHAAAAVNVPAVICFGEFISPRVTGYEKNANLFSGKGLGCGMRNNCAGCQAAMARITSTEVFTQLKSVLETGRVADTPNVLRV